MSLATEFGRLSVLRIRFGYGFFWGASLTIVGGLAIPVIAWLLTRPEAIGIPLVVGMVSSRDRHRAEEAERVEPIAEKPVEQVFTEIFLVVAIVVAMAIFPTVLYLIARPRLLSLKWIGGLILLISVAAASFGYYCLRPRLENPADKIGFFFGVAAGPIALYQSFLWVIGTS